MKHPIPRDALDLRLGFIGTSGSSPVKSNVADPRNRARPRPCAVCGELFAPHRKRDDAKYCSKSCIWVDSKGPEFNARIARESAAQRGDALRGRGDGKSYRKLNGRHEHREVAEQRLGRALAPGEIVHHDDEAKLNNDPGNLVVLPSQADHARLHFAGKKQSPEHVRKRIEARIRTIRARKSA